MLQHALVRDVDVLIKKRVKCGAGCQCKNGGNIPSSVANGSPVGRQLSIQPHLAVEEEESLYETQLREQGGDELVHLDEEELQSEVVVVTGEYSDDSGEEDMNTDSDYDG